MRNQEVFCFFSSEKKALSIFVLNFAVGALPTPVGLIPRSPSSGIQPQVLSL